MLQMLLLLLWLRLLLLVSVFGFEDASCKLEFDQMNDSIENLFFFGFFLHNTSHELIAYSNVFLFHTGADFEFGYVKWTASLFVWNASCVIGNWSRLFLAFLYKKKIENIRKQFSLQNITECRICCYFSIYSNKQNRQTKVSIWPCTVNCFIICIYTK